jgi:hypothetical protein
MEEIKLHEKQQVVADRLAICAECPELIKKIYVCKKCGCFMHAKAWLMDAWCPLNKWGKAEIKE